MRSRAASQKKSPKALAIPINIESGYKIKATIVIGHPRSQMNSQVYGKTPIIRVRPSINDSMASIMKSMNAKPKRKRGNRRIFRKNLTISWQQFYPCKQSQSQQLSLFWYAGCATG